MEEVLAVGIGRMSVRLVMSAALAVAVATAGCTAGVATTGTVARAVRPRLTEPHPCPGITGFTCSTLAVPLDHFGHVRGTLRLQVAAADNADAPRGVLLLLTGGPFVIRLAARLAPVLHAYRLVMFDQRGTGQFGAINCPALQAAVGSSDV